MNAKRPETKSSQLHVPRSTFGHAGSGPLNGLSGNSDARKSMALHFEGETIDKSRAHVLAQNGKLVPLIGGMCAEAGDRIDEAVLAYSVRIAHYA
jgi:hypothetical protein